MSILQHWTLFFGSCFGYQWYYASWLHTSALYFLFWRSKPVLNFYGLNSLLKGNSTNTENSHCQLVHCSLLRWWWSCPHCSTRWLDTPSTVVGPAETVSWSVSPSAASSSSPRKKEFLKDKTNKTKQKQTGHVNSWFSFFPTSETWR